MMFEEELIQIGVQLLCKQSLQQRVGWGGVRPTAGHRIPEGHRCLVVVENVCGGPWIYSARESNMPIVEELRMDVLGPVICGLFL